MEPNSQDEIKESEEQKEAQIEEEKQEIKELEEQNEEKKEEQTKEIKDEKKEEQNEEIKEEQNEEIKEEQNKEVKEEQNEEKKEEEKIEEKKEEEKIEEKKEEEKIEENNEEEKIEENNDEDKIEEKKEEEKKEEIKEEEKKEEDKKEEEKIEEKNEEEKKEEKNEEKIEEEKKEEKNEEEKKEEIKEEGKDEINEEEKKEEKKDQIEKEQNKEKKEEKQEYQNKDSIDEPKEDLNDLKSKSTKNAIEKIPFQEFKQEKAFTLEEKEKDKVKSYLKDDSYERNASIFESHSPNSFQNNDISILKKIRDDGSDYDKIVSGKDESQINSGSFNLEEKDSSMRSDQEKDKNSMNNSVLNVYKDFRFKRNSIKLEHGAIFKSISEEKEKNVKLKDIINAQMTELKDSTLTFFAQTIKELEHRYTEYINNICDYVAENEMKLNKVFHQNNEDNENIIEFTKNNILQQIENLMEIHDNICDALEDHAVLLGTFLEKPDLIQQKNPLEYFINTYSSNIINSWFLYKINFQKLNIRSFDTNKDLSELYVKYLVKQKNKNFKNFTITQDINGNLSNGANFAKQNIKSIEKLKFDNVRAEEINKVFEVKKKGGKEQDNTARKLKSLSLIKSNFSTIALNKLYTPSLKKLKIKRIILPLSLAGFFDSILFKSSFLQNIYLQKCFIDDESLSQFFKYLSEKPELMESLKNISFAGNEITSVSMDSLIEKKCIFQSLEVLDFSKNNIFEFSTENFKLLMNLKVLDLTDNNLTNYTFFENIKNLKTLKCVLFLCNNMFLINNRNNTNKYIKYLVDRLGNFKSKIKKINLSFLYDKVSKPIIQKLLLSPMIKISLIKLNLSYCGLDNETVCKFLNNNFGLLSLKVLNLRNNFIDLKFFISIKSVDLSLEKLKCLDIGLNELQTLTFAEYLNIEYFINKHPNLKKIKVQQTTFIQDLLTLTQNEPDKLIEVNKNLINREIKFIIEKDDALTIEPLKELIEYKNIDD